MRLLNLRYCTYNKKSGEYIICTCYLLRDSVLQLNYATSDVAPGGFSCETVVFLLALSACFSVQDRSYDRSFQRETKDNNGSILPAHAFAGSPYEADCRPGVCAKFGRMALPSVLGCLCADKQEALARCFFGARSEQIGPNSGLSVYLAHKQPKCSIQPKRLRRF